MNDVRNWERMKLAFYIFTHKRKLQINEKKKVSEGNKSAHSMKERKTRVWKIMAYFCLSNFRRERA